ncbi:MAG: AAA family ATPase [Spirochaetaceae bacterium]|nr:AAA family ATPase [Spirochaetaceae bacterium]
MKILSVELKNINSLAGTWKIDFTDPSFVQNHNIFVIFGDTGSGKSSILDAITIALYGRTPRQDRINSSGNEVMTRNTASCMARLKYQCRKGVFISEWRQRRAKDKISGRLQDPEFCVMREDGTLIDEGKAANLAEVTQKIIELDYKQFVRSIILAQGEFSHFLDCKPNERAEILEKLDGSDNYRKIAVAIANRADEEESLFQEKKRDIDFFNNKQLSDEELDARRTELVTLSEQRKDAEDELLRLHKYEQWYEALDQKEKRHGDALVRLSDAVNAIELFEPSARKIQKADKALLCEVSYNAVVSARNALKERKKEFEEISANLIKEKETLSECERKKEEATSSLSECKSKQKDLELLWQKVRDIDTRKDGATYQKDEAQKRYDDVFGKLQSVKEELEKARSLSSELTEKASVYEEYGKEHSADAGIESVLSGLGEKINQFERVSAEVKTRSEAEENLLPEITRLENVKNELLTKKEKLEAYIEDHKTDEKLSDVISFAKNKSHDISASEEELSEIKEKLDKTRQDIEKAEENLAGLNDIRNEILSELDTYFLDETQFIAGELQKRLIKGKPCPVCGSLEHPACDETSAGEGASNGANNVAERTASFAERVRNMQLRRDKNNEDIQHTETELTVLKGDKKTLLNKIEDLEKEKISAYKAFCDAVSSWINAIPESSKDFDKLLAVLKEKSEAYRDGVKELAQLKEEISDNTIAFTGKKKDFDNNSASLKAARDEKERYFDAIKETCSPWLPENAFSFDKFDGGGCLESLSERAKLWAENKACADEAEKRLLELSAEEKTLSDQQTIRESDERTAKTALTECESALSALTAERQELFGEQSVEECQRAFSEKLESLAAAVDKATSEADAARNSVTGLEASLREHEKLLKNAESAYSEASVAFTEKLSENGFASEDDFLESRLEPSVISSLKEKQKQLSDNKISAESSVRETEDDLTAHKKLFDDVPTKEELASSKEKVNEELDSILGSIGKITAELEENERNKAAAQDKLAALEAQKALRDKWAKLRGLMGNKDGSSFSIFVQGITFRHLLKLANKHLALMKDRYELVPKGDVDFEINDASFSSPRSVTNISGGERFLISLSLALGIADFASRTVRVDSLFLDEGFGSLDGETLRNVLDCLKRQQQKEGKMLGIITHVDTVVDSIAQKIEVKPAAGGHSIIRGEGISHLG